jgi:hypothetical protein
VVPGQLYTPSDQIDMVNCKRRKEGIIRYLMSHCSDPSERQAVIDSVSANLKHLNVVINHEDLNPPVTEISVNFVAVARPEYVPQRPLIPERPLPPIEPIRRVPVRPIPDPYIRRAPIPDPRPAERPPPPPPQKKDCVIL